MCVITGCSSRGADQDARSLLPQSLPALGAKHHCSLHTVGLLQQESGEGTTTWNVLLDFNHTSNNQTTFILNAPPIFTCLIFLTVWFYLLIERICSNCSLRHPSCQNASFTVPWLGMSGLGILSKTPLGLLGQARSCCSPSPLHSAEHTQLYRSANSFHVFLRLLALCLAQDRAGGVPQRQIKGR